MIGRVICGYQGVGKSSISGVRNGIVDLESSNFYVDGVRPDNWVSIYVNIVGNLIGQGFDVFCSAHPAIREELTKRNIKYTIITPSVNIKAGWLERLSDRYKQIPSEKNKRALEGARNNYEEDVTGLLGDPNANRSIEIKSLQYNLLDLL